MPKLRTIPRTALGALIMARRGDRADVEVAAEIGISRSALGNLESGRVRIPKGIALVARWLGIEVEEARRLAATSHVPEVEGPDDLARAALAKRGRRQLQEVAAEVGTTPTRYRRVELGGGSAEVREMVWAWVER